MFKIAILAGVAVAVLFVVAMCRAAGKPMPDPAPAPTPEGDTRLAYTPLIPMTANLSSEKIAELKELLEKSSMAGQIIHVPFNDVEQVTENIVQMIEALAAEFEANGQCGPRNATYALARRIREGAAVTQVTV
jgi:hypothetical protein